MSMPPSRLTSAFSSRLRDQVVPSAPRTSADKRFLMNNQSRIAAREGFAHQRARLLFSQRPNIYPSVTDRAPIEGPKRQRDIVRDGLIGFVPSGRQ